VPVYAFTGTSLSFLRSRNFYQPSVREREREKGTEIENSHYEKFENFFSVAE
jgi:hypothetical protein